MKRGYIPFILIAIILGSVGCRPVDIGQPGNVNRGQGLSISVRNAIEPYALNLAGWEINNLVSAGDKNPAIDSADGDFSLLPEYISVVLNEENIAVFPQVRVRLEEPPSLLVISPRERIAYYDRVLLIPGLTVDVMAKIEEKVDALGLSSLIVQLGGLGAAYPAIVSPDMAPVNIINAAVEEWAHQYLAFKPLGFLYLTDSLGLRQDPAIIVMNETLAGIIAREIGDKVYERYYFNKGIKVRSPDPAVFDFDREMRETRRNVDALLDAGRIDEAERYMEGKRIDFNRYGYAIRKLNQAYFAFHGIYGQDPGAVSPVYQNMLKLRRACPDLAGFVDRISGMTAYADLEKAVSGLAD